MDIAKVIKFPNKARRRAYTRKLWSAKNRSDIFVVTVGVLLAEIIWSVFAYIVSALFKVVIGF